MSKLPDGLDSLNRQILAGHRHINGASRRLGKSWLVLAAAAGLAGGLYRAYDQGYLVVDDLTWLREEKTPVGEPKAHQPAEASPESKKTLAGKPKKPLAGEPEKIDGLQADKGTREPILVIRKQEKARLQAAVSPRPRNRPEAAKAEAKTEAHVVEQAKAPLRLVVEEEGVRIIGPEGETFIPIGGSLNGRRILATSPKIGLIITEDRAIRANQERAETEAKKDEKEAAMAVQ